MLVEQDRRRVTQVRRSDIVVPDIVAAKAVVDGDGGRGWVDALPRIVAELEEQWSIRVGDQLSGGTSAYVAQAQTSDGTAVVVKVVVPTPDFEREVRTLRLADGRGYVRLLAADPPRQAVLLEQLGRPMPQLAMSPEQQLVTLAAVLKDVWAVAERDVQDDHGWPGPPVDKAAGLAELVTQLYQELGHPCPERVLRRALECADGRSADFAVDRLVPVHGDAAAGNLLEVPAARQGAETGFVFVDPNTFLGDPAYDLGVALRDWGTELLAGDAPALARRWCRLLADAGGLDEISVWQWGYLERVSTGLYAMSLTAGAMGVDHLLTAEALCSSGPDR
jgi:streptomycin 6-kinase